MTSVRIDTDGCKLNQADSQGLARSFSRAGYKVVSSKDTSDVYVLNTCTVTEVADRKARQTIRAARRANPEAFIVATGCYAQRAPNDLLSMSDVDLVMDNTDKDAIVERVLDLTRGSKRPYLMNNRIVNNLAYRTRAMVKIQVGCNQVCSYCIVPKVRGREKSVPIDEIVRQILALESEGVQEVVLTGTQLISYGFDMPDADLSLLLDNILAKTGVPRLRVSSLQPKIITRAFLSRWSDPRLCPHFHMPLQSGSDDILALMKRRYTAYEFSKAVDLIHDSVSDVSITTDVIAGFPGEDEKDFEATYDMCSKLEFADLHVFPYSIRPGTSASYFPNRVERRTRGRRSKLLSGLSGYLSKSFRTKLLGETRMVLWEDKGRGTRDGMWSGLTDNYVRVYTTFEEPLANNITNTWLTKDLDDSLLGEPIV